MKKVSFKMICVIFLAVMTTQASSQDYETVKLKDRLPKLQSASSVGTDFWFTVPPCYEDEMAALENSVYIFVTGTESAFVTVEVAGKGFLMEKQLQANTTVDFVLLPDAASPWRKSGSKKPPAEKIIQGAGIHVYSDVPVTVYCVVSYRAATEGFLVLPSSSLGNKYIVSSYGSMDALTEEKFYPSLSGCCATENGTKVSFTLGGNPTTKTTGGMISGDSIKYTLNKGDVVMFASNGDANDLTGSVWQSDKPIAVVSGNYCADIPIDNRWCDYSCEMDQPTNTWGTSYHVPKIHGRKYPSIIRIFASEPNTTIYKDGAHNNKLTKAGGRQNEGWYEIRMAPLSDLPKSVLITADKPIGITFCNTGAQEDGSPMPNSDPFLLAMLPDDAFNKELSFSTPGTTDSNDFQENYINLVYETEENGETPEGLKFGWIVDGKFLFRRVLNMFPGVDEKFYDDNSGKKYAVKQLSIDSNAVCKIIGDKPFAAYSYGYRTGDSYGFPTAIGTERTVITKEGTAPVPTWTMQCNGDVDNGYVKDMPDDVRRSGLRFIGLDKRSENYKLTQDPIVYGSTNEAGWKLEVIDKSKRATAYMVFGDIDGNDTVIVIQNKLMSGMVFSPSYIHLGNIITDSVQVLPFTIKNKNQAPVTITKLYLKNGNQGFSIGSPSLPFTIAAGDSVTINIYISYDTPAILSDTLIAGNDCDELVALYLSAKTVQPVIEVSDIDFDTVYTGKKYDRNLKISNKSTIALHIISHTAPNHPEFSSNIPDYLLTMTANNDMIYKVSFESQKEGVFIDSIVFQTEAGTNTDNVAILRAVCVKANAVEDGNTGQEASGLKIAVNPNPVNNGKATVRLISDRDCGAEITVCNIAGRQLFNNRTYTIQAGENTIELDLSRLPSGVYYLLVKSRGSAEKVKFNIIR